MNRRVVVTGVGVISNIGLNTRTFWDNLLAGVSGITEIKGLHLSRYKHIRTRGGEVHDFRANHYFSDERRLGYGRSTQMALVAAQEALADAGLENKSADDRRGVVFGTTSAEGQEIEKMDDLWAAKVPLSRQDPQTFLNVLPQFIPSAIAREFNCTGPAVVIQNACSSSNYAIAQSTEYIKQGKMDVMITGGTDSFSRLLFAGFCKIGVVSSTAPKPFSFDRDGMIVSEGAGVLVLEDYEHARKRNSTIYAEIIGSGFSNDAFHITQCHAKGISLGFVDALRNSKISAQEVSYISAHGTGTLTNDKNEGMAIKDVFGTEGSVPVNSIKASIGHSMGAASALEAIASVLSIRDQVIPPTMNFTQIEPLCEGLDIVANQPRQTDVNIVFETASGFGGNNCINVFKRV